jgi:hypothetical protein
LQKKPSRGRKTDYLSKADAAAFRAWLGRVRQKWEGHGKSWIGTLVEPAPCRRRTDGSREGELPERDRDFFMRAQNPDLPLGKKKALEICLRLWRHSIVAANDNIVRMLIDTTDEQLVCLPQGKANAVADHLIDRLESRGNLINEAGRDDLRNYLERYESLVNRDPELRAAIWSFQSRHRGIPMWKLSRSKDYGKGTTFTTPSLFTRLEQETRDVQFDVRGERPN